MSECACGSGNVYKKCCEPYHNGKSNPPTAESLMRARYCAYVVQKIDFIMDTIDPKRLDDYDRGTMQAWAEQSDWLGLEIVRTEGGGKDDSNGTVEFIARFATVSGDGKEKVQSHHEASLFRKEKGKWLYVEGDLIAVQPIMRETPKVGRNDPCSCGSGKKFKKCCDA